MLILSGVFILLEHTGFSSRLIDITFLMLSVGVITYIWETNKQREN